MKVTAIKDFSKSITKGKQYKVVTEKKSTFVVVDDEGFYLGLSKDFFEYVQKQSSIKWLEERIKEMFLPLSQEESILKDIEQAKELHKQDIVEAYNKGREAGVGDYIDIEWGRNGTELTAEQYYNETFGKKF